MCAIIRTRSHPPLARSYPIPNPPRRTRNSNPLPHDVQKQNTPLHLAAEKGHTEVVRVLVKFGASTEALNYRQYTPMHRAALLGHVDAVGALLELGAKVDTAAGNGDTALILAGKNTRTQ